MEFSSNGTRKSQLRDQSNSPAHAMNYALKIQRHLGRDFAVEVSYVVSQGRKLVVDVDRNQPAVMVNESH